MPVFYLSKRLYKIGYIMLCGLGVMVIFHFNFKQTYANKNTSSVVKFLTYLRSGTIEDGIDKRVYIYDCSLKLIKSAPILGYGVGDVQNKLDTCYARHEYTVAEYESEGIPINSHNYYFHLYLAAGVLGLLLFLYFLFVNFFLAISTRGWHYMFFLFLITLNLLTENLLVRIYGVTPFVFFTSVFSLNLIKDE